MLLKTGGTSLLGLLGLLGLFVLDRLSLALPTQLFLDALCPEDVPALPCA